MADDVPTFDQSEITACDENSPMRSDSNTPVCKHPLKRGLFHCAANDHAKATGITIPRKLFTAPWKGHPANTYMWLEFRVLGRHVCDFGLIDFMLLSIIIWALFNSLVTATWYGLITAIVVILGTALRDVYRGKPFYGSVINTLIVLKNMWINYVH